MSEIKFSKIVSFSSEDSGFRADNLLSNKKWIGSNAGLTKQSVVIEVEKNFLFIIELSF